MHHGHNVRTEVFVYERCHDVSNRLSELRVVMDAMLVLAGDLVRGRCGGVDRDGEVGEEVSDGGEGEGSEFGVQSASMTGGS